MLKLLIDSHLNGVCKQQSGNTRLRKHVGKILMLSLIYHFKLKLLETLWQRRHAHYKSFPPLPHCFQSSLLVYICAEMHLCPLQTTWTFLLYRAKPYKTWYWFVINILVYGDFNTIKINALLSRLLSQKEHFLVVFGLGVWVIASY